MHRTDGALAAKAQAAPLVLPSPPPPETTRPEPPRPPVQRPLFPVSNVIPFEQYAPARPEPAPAKRASARGQGRGSRTPEGQQSLELLSPSPAKPLTKSGTAEAVVCCDAPVATRLHRALATAADCSMVLIAYGLFLAAYSAAGGQFLLNKKTMLLFVGMFGLIAFAYGLIWALAATETAGMRWMRLRLVTFDGFPPDLKQRLLRFAASCLSMCTMLGLLWSLADEETLTWQDHISRTFPTPVEYGTRAFVRR